MENIDQYVKELRMAIREYVEALQWTKIHQLNAALGVKDPTSEDVVWAIVEDMHRKGEIAIRGERFGAVLALIEPIEQHAGLVPELETSIMRYLTQVHSHRPPERVRATAVKVSEHASRFGMIKTERLTEYFDWLVDNGIAVSLTDLEHKLVRHVANPRVFKHIYEGGRACGGSKPASS